ncbi:hypothetical protein C8R47DRAFT_1068758 [Mycena vitilis]|nr:hypothetical protein C8R47DRAFT_1068758 [Mycena vitilis]
MSKVPKAKAKPSYIRWVQVTGRSTNAVSAHSRQIKHNRQNRAKCRLLHAAGVSKDALFDASKLGCGRVSRKIIHAAVCVTLHKDKGRTKNRHGQGVSENLSDDVDSPQDPGYQGGYNPPNAEAITPVTIA